MTLAEVNAMAQPDFVDRFGDVAEHSPWVAERAASRRPFASVDAMVAAFQAAIRDALEAEQLRLIRAHPDLAGRAGMAEESRKEQAGAGLDQLTPEEFARFTELNNRYRERFGIPFILAVKGATRHQILDSFAARLGNDRDTELANALNQVCRIVGFRLGDRVAP
jgi:2-oxo-4-hydroxy-4-carboxy-5-ureidoimidazoline decarboxylase